VSQVNDLQAVLNTADELFPESAVEQAITVCADAAAAKLADQAPVVLVVMNGGMSFADRLLARWSFPLELDYIHFTRYDGATQGGSNKQIANPRTPLQGRHVVVVDDIFDEGLTLADIHDWVLRQGASAVTSIVLTEKLHDRQKTDYRADYVALQVPDRYVFGYGMDYYGWLRNIRGIYAVQEALL